MGTVQILRFFCFLDSVLLPGTGTAMAKANLSGLKLQPWIGSVGWAGTFPGSLQVVVFFPTCIRAPELELPSSEAFTSAHITWVF